MSTELHWFRRPGTDSHRDKGTFNPVFELLDHPIAAGRGDEIFFADAEVSLTYADALDRVAKFAGILHAVHEPAPPFLVVDDGLRPVTLMLGMLAGLRLGSCVVLGTTGLKPGEQKRAPILRPEETAPGGVDGGLAGAQGGSVAAGTHGGDVAAGAHGGARAGMHTGTRRIYSYFEHTELLADGPGSKPLDAGSLMKEAAFKHAEPAGVGPGREVLRLDGVAFSAVESLTAVQTLLRG